MKVVILAGGFGTRISEESHLVPKPMIKIGGKPILWHIMQYFSSFGHREFVILAGYKQEVIKDYFNNYYLHNSDTTFHLKDQTINFLKSYSDDWIVTVLDTGLETMTAGRLFVAREHLKNDEAFFLTYGDGLSDVNLDELLRSHKNSSAIATLTAIRPKGRFGSLTIKSTNFVESFKEKTENESSWVNGGFMVINNAIFDYLSDHKNILETDILPKIAHENKLLSFKHYGFWQSMDTLRDKQLLEELIINRNTPWIK
jgi:glucose-1-phosphate cytidylyltransferase